MASAFPDISPVPSNHAPPNLSPLSPNTPTVFDEWFTPPASPSYMSSPVQDNMDWCRETLSDIAQLCVLANLDQDMINTIMHLQEEYVAVHSQLSNSVPPPDRWSLKLRDHVDSCLQLHIKLQKEMSRTSRLRLQQAIPADESSRPQVTPLVTPEADEPRDEKSSGLTQKSPKKNTLPPSEPAVDDSGRLSPIITEFEQKPKPSANSPSSLQYLLGSILNPIPPPAYTPRPRANDQAARPAAPEQHWTSYGPGMVMNGCGPVIWGNYK